jgi:tetratricopeptide (TPR) repeat protein
MHRLVQDVARTTTDAGVCAATIADAVALVDRVLPGRPWEHEQWPTRACGCTSTQPAPPVMPSSITSRASRPRACSHASGSTRRARAQYATARELLQRALAINEAVYGPEHPEIAITLTNLGNVQQQLGEFEAARASQQRALAINEAVYGPEHPEIAITLTNLGSVQPQLGERDRAREHARRAVAIFERHSDLSTHTPRKRKRAAREPRRMTPRATGAARTSWPRR